MANTTVCIDEAAYTVVVGYDQGTEDGYKFVIQQDNWPKAVTVEDSGKVQFGGTILHDQSVPIKVVNTDSSATYIARFLRGPTKLELLTVREDKSTDISGGELILRATSTFDPPSDYRNGDVFCYYNASKWWFSIRHDGAPTVFEAVLV